MDKDQTTELHDALDNAAGQAQLAVAALWELVEDEGVAEYRLRESPDLRVIAEATAAAMQKLARAQALVVRAVVAREKTQ